MSDYIPDPIQRGEAAAEDWYFSHLQPDGRLKCCQCANVFDPEKEGGTISPDPYAPMVCGECLCKEIDSEKLKPWS